MLATGNSSAEAADNSARRSRTVSDSICLVACPEGIARFTTEQPGIPIYTAAIDSHLNDNAYIVPGLGDAGDRYFGT